MRNTAPRVVFDCMIYTQALISKHGPAADCLNLVWNGQLHLVWSNYVLQEIRELPGKLPARFAVTTDRVEAFILAIAPFAEHIALVRESYVNPFDRDDSHYINLAIASDARIITSRDKDLLRLMDETLPVGREFRKLFPQLQILTPDVLLKLVRAMQ